MKSIKKTPKIVSKKVTMKPKDSLEVISIYEAIEILESTFKDEDNEEEQNLTFDFLQFAMELIGKKGPVYLNVCDIPFGYSGGSMSPDGEEIDDMVIGEEGEYVSVHDAIKCLKKLAVLMPKRGSWHFAGINETGKPPMMYVKKPKIIYKIDFD